MEKEKVLSIKNATREISFIYLVFFHHKHRQTVHQVVQRAMNCPSLGIPKS